MRIGLVGCVKTKLPRAARAADLYTSALFQGRREYVERTCDRWFILSALHGLVKPDTVLEPYDVTLINASPRERREWASKILNALEAEVGPLADHSFEIHAGADYRDFGLVRGLLMTNASVDIPTAGLGLFQQMAFYKTTRALKSDGSTAQSTRRMGKYAGFSDWLGRQASSPLNLSFRQVEEVLGFTLPASARRHNAYWSGGQPGSTIGNAIRTAGWRATSLNLTGERVTLERVQ